MASQTELDILQYVKAGMPVEEIGKKLKLGDGVYSVMHKLADEGLVKLDSSTERSISLGDEGIKHAKEGLPERRALDVVRQGPAGVGDLAAKAKLKGPEVKIALVWLKKKGWADIAQGKVKLTEGGRKACKKDGPDEALLKVLLEGGKKEEELVGHSEGIKLLKDRQDNLAIKERQVFEAKLTKKGETALKVEKGSGGKEIHAITKDMLKSGSWRGKSFRSYGVREAIDAYPAKLHPLRIAMEKIKRIFLELGFKETSGNFIESSFWNFDALFQPQDHPARELADTFYLEQLEHELPEHHKPVKAMHEEGGDIESRGWQYEWDLAKAKKCVLRTHTTAVSARSLTKIEVPAKLFSIGRVFRNEAIDYKHLAEFYQVEGIVVGEEVNFTNLLWYLKEFYNKLGFEKVRFRPAYFPYTEMSCEPEVYFEEKGEWVELGGSGIFRSEVVKPLLGIEVPVLAWGLSLERPLMMKMGLEDIRTFYRNDLDWLRQYEMDVL